MSKQLFELVDKVEAAKKAYKELANELDTALRALPVDSYVQNPDNKVVLKVVVPTGTFIEFKTIGYERTKKADEVKGSLSMKEAEAAGFVIK